MLLQKSLSGSGQNIYTTLRIQRYAKPVFPYLDLLAAEEFTLCNNTYRNRVLAWHWGAAA